MANKISRGVFFGRYYNCWSVIFGTGGEALCTKENRTPYRRGSSLATNAGHSILF